MNLKTFSTPISNTLLNVIHNLQHLGPTESSRKLKIIDDIRITGCFISRQDSIYPQVLKPTRPSTNSETAFIILNLSSAPTLSVLPNSIPTHQILMCNLWLHRQIRCRQLTFCKIYLQIHHRSKTPHPNPETSITHCHGLTLYTYPQIFDLAIRYG
jgi:hypothetical protein